MANPEMAKPKKIKHPTQRYLDIAEIKDDCVILKDGTLRKILLVSSINFALKSAEEQDAIIGAYANFLNSFDFPIQIVIQSRKLDIEGYLDRLKRAQKEQTNELLKMQITEYIQYVAELVKLGDIMNKRFYLIVPYSALAGKQKNFWVKVGELFSPTSSVKLKQKQFEKYKWSLNQRAEHVLNGLASMGLKAAILDTQSLIELYYNTYNIDMPHQQLPEIQKLDLEEVAWC